MWNLHGRGNNNTHTIPITCKLEEFFLLKNVIQYFFLERKTESWI